MGFYELMEKSIDCCNKAIDFWKKKEFDLAKFWINASRCYKEKALNLIIGEKNG